ncbi:mercuric reductase [Longimicrobium sp.]|uniref:dihydrolipoyl dehydrogenase family protein n=1 Tax=Longimicrobium sp. TaxID=2029185 RepID=UPI002C8F1D24|nr:mercuric reductase [Longimicrobium sp.]HSU17699.1 mercuric reductase [Longimicrobium sp.]
MERYDLAVIGGGTAGLVSAAVSAGIGARTALVEQHRLGGECLWTGCVPSKAIIRSAAVLHTLRRAADFGIEVDGGRADFRRVMERVHAVIRQIEPHDSPERFRGMGVDVVEGRARFVSPGEAEVGGRRIRSKRWILATGSRTAIPQIAGLEEAGYLTHETLWDLRALPESMLVLGAGPIGIEMAQAFARLGSRVTVVSAAEQVLHREDPEIAAVLRRQLEREGITLHLGTRATAVRVEDGQKVITIRTKTGEMEIRAAVILVATGRKPNVEEMGLDAIGVESTDKGVTVDAALRTSASNVWAAGDVAGPYRFTHVADYQARIAAPNALFPLRRKVDYRVVPWCTYTEPEVARVGLTEAEARDEWGDKAGVFRYGHDSLDRALCDGEPEGLTKLVLDPKGRIAGAHVVGPRAGETIHEAVLAVRHRLKLSDLSGMIHIYPTYPESLKRAADAFLRAKYSGGLARRVADLAVRWLV